MKFRGFECLPSGEILAVFDDTYNETFRHGRLVHAPTISFLKRDLEVRAANLEASGDDATQERAALARWPVG